MGFEKTLIASGLGFYGRAASQSCVWVLETVSSMRLGQILWTSRQAPALLAPLARDPRGRDTLGTPQTQQQPAPAPAPSWLLLPGTFSALPAEITNRAQYPEPTVGTQVVHFRLSGLDLYDFVLAPCLLGCAGTGRHDPVSTSLCLAGLRYSSACHSIPVTQVF